MRSCIFSCTSVSISFFHFIFSLSISFRLLNSHLSNIMIVLLFRKVDYYDFHIHFSCSRALNEVQNILCNILIIQKNLCFSFSVLFLFVSVVYFARCISLANSFFSSLRSIISLFRFFFFLANEQKLKKQ